MFEELAAHARKQGWDSTPARDNKHEASRSLEAADMLLADDTQALVVLASAQASATLALVEATERVAEQARIGNLVMYSLLVIDNPAFAGPASQQSALQVIDEQIREGLNLA